MNKAEFASFQNTVSIEYRNAVSVKLIRVQSDFYFLSSAQVTDFPKGRGET